MNRLQLSNLYTTYIASFPQCLSLAVASLPVLLTLAFRREGLGTTLYVTTFKNSVLALLNVPRPSTPYCLQYTKYCKRSKLEVYIEGLGMTLIQHIVHHTLMAVSEL